MFSKFVYTTVIEAILVIMLPYLLCIEIHIWITRLKNQKNPSK